MFIFSICKLKRNCEQLVITSRGKCMFHIVAITDVSVTDNQIHFHRLYYRVTLLRTNHQ